MNAATQRREDIILTAMVLGWSLLCGVVGAAICFWVMSGRCA